MFLRNTVWYPVSLNQDKSIQKLFSSGSKTNRKMITNGKKVILGILNSVLLIFVIPP